MDDDDDAYWLSQIPPQQKTYVPAKTMGSIIRKWMTQRGVANVQEAGMTQQQWQLAVGEDLSSQSRAGNIRRGTLYVSVASNLVIQELHLRKKQILIQLAENLPDFKIKDLRLKVEKF